jgi:DNA-binding NtrC family response regulator
MFSQRAVLLIGNEDETTRRLEEVLDGYGKITKVREVNERDLLNSNYDAIVCAWEFMADESSGIRRRTWRSLLDQAQRQCPNRPVIVYRHDAGEEEWLEVLEAGAFDLLAAPFSMSTVLSALEHACSSCDARDAHRTAAYSFS